MDFEQAKAFRARIRAGMTTAEAVRSRYTEATLDTVEGSHRATAIATDDERAPYQRREPTEAEMLAALKERAANGWALLERKVPT